MALKAQNHVDTVLWYRSKWLKQIALNEGNPKFDKLNREVSLPFN